MVRVVFVLLCGYRLAGVGVRQEAERKRAEDEAEAARQAEVHRQRLQAAKYVPLHSARVAALATCNAVWNE